MSLTLTPNAPQLKSSPMDTHLNSSSLTQILIQNPKLIGKPWESEGDIDEKKKEKKKNEAESRAFLLVRQMNPCDLYGLILTPLGQCQV